VAFEVLREVRLIVEADVGRDPSRRLAVEKSRASRFDAAADHVAVRRDPEPRREGTDEMSRRDVE
jgi:hypothetical protein